MKVKEIIEKLQTFNEDAEFTVIFNNKEYNVNELVWSSGGESDSTNTKQSALTVSPYINSSNENY
jgi:hypothetical protein